MLKNSLPTKTEHVLFVRMTDIQRKLYSRFMEELITNRLPSIRNKYSLTFDDSCCADVSPIL